MGCLAVFGMRSRLLMEGVGPEDLQLEEGGSMGFAKKVRHDRDDQVFIDWADSLVVPDFFVEGLEPRISFQVRGVSDRWLDGFILADGTKVFVHRQILPMEGRRKRKWDRCDD